MSPAHSPEGRIEELFARALEQPEGERERFLAAMGGPEAAPEVARLLAAHAAAGTRFLGVDEGRRPGRGRLEPGEVLSGRFAIRGLAGSGGMSEVYRAEDLQLGGTVAVKVMRWAAPGSLARFRQEIQLARRITHPNVYRVFDVGVDRQRIYLTMEWLDGETLGARLGRGPLGEAEAREVLEQVAAGLAAAHERGIVHRDLKPSNVMLTPAGAGTRAVVLDFGIARESEEADGLTGTGERLGTLGYMAPEQREGRPVSAATDMYALGLLALAVRRGITPPDPAAAAELAEPWRSAVARAVERDPARRWAGAEAFTAALRAPEKPRWGWPGGRAGLAAGAAVAAALAAWAVAGGARGGRQAWELYLEGQRLLGAHYKTGNLEAAAERLRAAVAQDPGAALAWAALGEAARLRFARSGRPEEAAEAAAHCRKALALDPELASAYLTLGSLHAATGEGALAIQELERARKLDPRGAAPLAALGRAYENLGRAAEAETALRGAAARQPENWDIRQRLGAFFARQRRFAEAREEFERVVALAPGNAEAYANLAVAEKNLGQPGRAAELLRRSIAIQPSYAAYANLGNLAFDRGEWRAAREAYEQALGRNPRDYRIWGNLGWALRREGAAAGETRRVLGEAARRAEAAAAEQRTSGETFADAATFHAALGEREAMERALRTATAMEPENPEVHLKAAEAWEMAGRRPEAVAALREAVRRGGTVPGDPALRELARSAGVEQRVPEN